MADLEVVLVDDGSPEAANEVVAAIADPRLRLARHVRRRGPAAARNTGVREARAAIVAFLDSDDEWLAGMAAAHLDKLAAAGSDVVGSVTAYLLLEPDGRRSLRSAGTGAGLLGTLVRGCTLAVGSTMALRRPAWEQLGGEEESLERGEDWDLLLRMARRGWRLEFVEEPLCLVRHSLPGPTLEDIRQSSVLIGDRHLSWLAERSPVLARRLRSRLAYERGLAGLRHGRWITSVPPLAYSAVSDPRGRLPVLKRVPAGVRYLRRIRPTSAAVAGGSPTPRDAAT